MKTRKCRHCLGTGREPDQAALGLEQRARRKAAGIGLRQMAVRLKLSAPYLSDLELGRRHWNEGILAKYNEALNHEKH